MFSPFEIVKNQGVDYKKISAAEFGQYVQAYNDPVTTRTNEPRTIAGIFIGPLDNIQGGYEIYDLQTRRVKPRNKITVLPMTKEIQRRVEELAAADNVSTGLKFHNRKRQEFLDHDSDLLAGVDYDDMEFDDEYQQDDEPRDIPLQADEEIETQEYSDLIADLREDEKEMITRHRDEERFLEVQETQERKEDDHSDQDQSPDDEDDNHIQDTAINNAEQASTEKQSRFGRTLKPNPRYQHVQELPTATEKPRQRVRFMDDPPNTLTYDDGTSILIACLINEINRKAIKKCASFAQQLFLDKGLKKFGGRGHEAVHKELDQLHKRNCFTPREVSTLSNSEKSKAMRALMHLTEKRDGTIKARLCYNGKPTRQWINKDDAASPTAMTESVFITATIDAHEGRDVMVADIPNAFIQTLMPELKDGDERVFMKITGILVDHLVEMDSQLYGPFVTYENGQKVLYVEVLRAIYGMLIASMLWFKKFRDDLNKLGFSFNAYDPCVGNRTIYGNQQTVRFHVDDVMSSHISTKVNDYFQIWLNNNYGKYGEVKTSRGKVHEYLGMTFDFRTPGKVKIRMDDYIESMIREFPYRISNTDTINTPAGNNLFEEGKSKKLDRVRAEVSFYQKGRGPMYIKQSRCCLLE